jgi:hypothetical protein
MVDNNPEDTPKFVYEDKGRQTYRIVLPDTEFIYQDRPWTRITTSWS